MTHTFDSWTQRLMDTGPVIDGWQRKQVGPKNDGPYRTGYQNLPIHETNEPLVPLGYYGVSFAEYYLDKVYDYLLDGNNVFLPLVEQRIIWPFVWVRQSIATKLVRADALLRSHGLFLKVVSGWRSPIVQELAKDEATKKLGIDAAKRLFAATRVSKAQVISPHATGAALDIQLYSLETFKNLSASDKNDEFGFYNLEIKPDLTKENEMKKKIRRILYHVLCTPDICFTQTETFTIHPGEFWHFGYGDPLSSYLMKQPFAKYGATEPPKNYRITSFS